MKKIRFALVGTGWRAAFFLRIAKALPEQFEITHLLSRSQEKADAYAQKWGVPVTTNLAQVVAAKPDFAVLSVHHAATEAQIQQLGDAGLAILCETPPSKNRDALYRIWDYAKRKGIKIQVAEQYQFWPLYASLQAICQKGYLGEVSNMRLAALHGYHAVSIFRKLLGTGMGSVTVQGERFCFPVVETDSREGLVHTGEMSQAVRDVITLKWEDGKVAFFDFAGKHYHSLLRTRSLNIQGSRGEINDFEVRYLNKDGVAVQSNLLRNDRGILNFTPLSHLNMTLEGEVLYQNPFLYASLNDDEIAMATCLVQMQHYLDTGENACYSLADAMQDAAIATAMEEAVTTGQAVVLPRQPWADEESTVHETTNWEYPVHEKRLYHSGVLV